MLIGTDRSEWAQQTVLIALYGIASLCALMLSCSSNFRRWARLVPLDRMNHLEPVAFTGMDVLALTGFQLLSTDGIYPLLIMTLLPVLVGLDVSSKRAAAVLAFTLVGFAVAVVQDPVMVRAIGWPEAIFRFALYAFLCGTALVIVRVEERHIRSVAGLSALREELLAQTMTASEELQRRVSESLHDGPLQDVLAVRHELIELEAAFPGDERVDRALAGLQIASERLRQATFELHPAVLEEVGLGPAVEQLAAYTAKRSGIKVTTDVDYSVRSRLIPSCSASFASCCPTWYVIPRQPTLRSPSRRPTASVSWMSPTTAWVSATTPWRADWARDISAWRRIGPASTPPGECSSSSTYLPAPTSACSYPSITDGYGWSTDLPVAAAWPAR